MHQIQVEYASSGRSVAPVSDHECAASEGGYVRAAENVDLNLYRERLDATARSVHASNPQSHVKSDAYGMICDEAQNMHCKDGVRYIHRAQSSTFL